MIETQEVCACAVREPGDESGMVVCWKCEQPIAAVDPLAANIVLVLQRERDEARSQADALAEALEALYRSLPRYSCKADAPDGCAVCVARSALASYREYPVTNDRRAG